jgi:hypothetical protein
MTVLRNAIQQNGNGLQKTEAEYIRSLLWARDDVQSKSEHGSVCSPHGNAINRGGICRKY